jgi:hypothetical protein
MRLLSGLVRVMGSSPLPKRRNGPHPNQEPVCWGLQPIRQISIPAIVGLFVAIVVLSGVLGGLWLLKHPKDLGGAMAVPAVVVAYLGFGIALLQAYRNSLSDVSERSWRFRWSSRVWRSSSRVWRWSSRVWRSSSRVSLIHDRP